MITVLRSLKDAVQINARICQTLPHNVLMQESVRMENAFLDSRSARISTIDTLSLEIRVTLGHLHHAIL